MSAPIPSATDTLAGLTADEGRRRLAEFGPNVIAAETSSPWRAALAKLWAPISWLLEAAIVIQIGLGKYLEAAVIGGLLAFNATLGLLQESRATAALAALKKRLAPTALVRRDGIWTKRAAADLVPGDLIRLTLGAVVPADARIVSGSVMVDQSMLTGESVPIDAEAADQTYAGSLVRRGQALAEVTATGSRTYFGRAAELVRVAGAVSTEQRAIFGVVRKLAVVNGALAVLIVVYAHAIAISTADLVGLALTALLASIPVALPMTFTLSAAIGAQILSRRGVLLTRLTAAHEAAAMDVLCADKTGTLTRNALEVTEVLALAGLDRERVLTLAALASSESDQDPIDASIRRAAAGARRADATERLVRFVPFDPATRFAEATAVDDSGAEIRIAKGAFQAIARVAEMPADAQGRLDALAALGHRVIAVAAGPPATLRLAGLVAFSDPPREDSAELIAALRDLGVRTVMVTGDSAVTAAAIAGQVGIAGAVCPPERLSETLNGGEFGVFARVVPEEKYRLVMALQQGGHVVGMCGDGANDAPALRQAQIGIAVASATDVAKAAAGMVLTEPGLSGIVFAVREGRIAFRRLLTYTLNMLVKKTEIVLLLGIGLGITGHPVMTPVLMVLMLLTNDFLSMSLTTDRASLAPRPSVWPMQRITAAALLLGVCKLGFSTAMLGVGLWGRLGTEELQTLTFVTLVLGNQALLYVLRERGRMWGSRPSGWVFASSAVDVALVSALALSGTLMAPLAWPRMLVVAVATMAFALILDQAKRPILSALRME
ncbi:MAG TPA: HAD-IC family P-type ATPase [Thermoanaerobaculaceae bacterium]|nr:HAD-IC family P-type ATPase [Thermoanaerobaculaceae bacterium]